MNASRFLYPFITIFFVIAALTFVLKNTLVKWGFDVDVLLTANALFFILTLIVFLLQKKSLASNNPNRLVQAVMAGMLIKMVVVASSVLIYSRTAGKSFSKMSVLVGLGFYIIYLITEVLLINRLNKRPNA